MTGENLTPKQKRFCEIYLATGNACRAAREAGYKNQASGSENLEKPEIREYIADLSAPSQERRILNARERLELLSRLALGEISDHRVLSNGEVIPIPTKPSDRVRALALLSSIQGDLNGKGLVMSERQRRALDKQSRSNLLQDRIDDRSVVLELKKDQFTVDERMAEIEAIPTESPETQPDPAIVENEFLQNSAPIVDTTPENEVTPSEESAVENGPMAIEESQENPTENLSDPGPQSVFPPEWWVEDRESEHSQGKRRVKVRGSLK